MNSVCTYTHTHVLTRHRKENLMDLYVVNKTVCVIFTATHTSLQVISLLIRKNINGCIRSTLYFFLSVFNILRGA